MFFSRALGPQSCERAATAITGLMATDYATWPRSFNVQERPMARAMCRISKSRTSVDVQDSHQPEPTADPTGVKSQRTLGSTEVTDTYGQ